MPFFGGDASPFERLEAGLMHYGHEGLGDIRRSVKDVRECLGGDRLGLRGAAWDRRECLRSDRVGLRRGIRQQSVS